MEVDGPICEASPDALAPDALPADALPDALAADAIPDALVADYTPDAADFYATDGWAAFLFLMTCTGVSTAQRSTDKKHARPHGREREM